MYLYLTENQCNNCTLHSRLIMIRLIMMISITYLVSKDAYKRLNSNCDVPVSAEKNHFNLEVFFKEIFIFWNMKMGPSQSSRIVLGNILFTGAITNLISIYRFVEFHSVKFVQMQLCTIFCNSGYILASVMEFSSWES